MGGTPKLDAIRSRDRSIVIAVFLISATAAIGGYFLERNQSHLRGQIRFEQESQIVKDDLIATMLAYGQFARGGVALFHTAGDVTRNQWKRYVESLELSENYPGIQGVSYIAIARSPEALEELQRATRETDLADFQVKPPGKREFYTPVLYIEPVHEHNRKAIGFDVYSEPLRRAAIDRALSTREPSLTAKIQLVIENAMEAPVQAGILLISPVYQRTRLGDSNELPPNPPATGLIISAFRMGDLLTSILAKHQTHAADRIHIRLMDSVGGDSILYQSPKEHTAPLFSATETIELFGRTWSFQSSSTRQFERDVAQYGQYLVLGAGILVSLLLTSLAWIQAKRNRDTLNAASDLKYSNDKIATLMAEINHRSKNLLSLVQAIARQTSAGNPTEFATSFSRRLSALAASQDLLVKSEWKQVALAKLARSQLAHFDGLISSRIHVTGPDVGLSASTAQTLGMTIHELATNASKYGALSNEDGEIRIKWHFDLDPEGNDVFHMSWVERNGPAALAPKHEGFGSKVTGKMVKLSLAAQVKTEYEPAGFGWYLSCPASKIKD